MTCPTCSGRRSVPLTRENFERAFDTFLAHLMTPDYEELVAAGCRLRCPDCNRSTETGVDPNIARMYGLKEAA